jgi:DNA-binding response OmpR family regulator
MDAQGGGSVNAGEKTGAWRTRGKKRVVVVDDDPELVDRMRQLLGESYDFVATADWGVLNHIFFRDGCDLVLMDVNLPILKGDRLVQILTAGKKGDAGKRPVILYFSAEDETTMARLTRETGADGYLSKSLRSADLLKGIAARLAAPRAS